MTRVLLVGLQPEAVDYSDPALPPGMDAKKIQAGIELGLKQMTDRGWQADACLIQPDAIQLEDAFAKLVENEAIRSNVRESLNENKRLLDLPIWKK
jgi:hypothetical protein